MIDSTFPYNLNFVLAPDFSKVTFAPISFSEVGVHTVYIDIVDSAGAKLSKFFTLTVINDPPFFTDLSWTN